MAEDGKAKRKVLVIEEVIEEVEKSQGRAKASSVRTLSLQRKELTHLGTGLSGFVNLVKLDLSRNMLVSLSGLERCPALSTLVLYYNRLSELPEVKKLAGLKLLRDVDLRLNPFTREEHYRTYIVHSLPFLNRLDEREIGASEKRHAEDVLLDLGIYDYDSVGGGGAYAGDAKNDSRAPPPPASTSKTRDFDYDTNVGMEEIEFTFGANRSSGGGGHSSKEEGRGHDAEGDDNYSLPSPSIRRRKPPPSDSRSPKERNSLESQIDALLEDVSGAISEVVLPHRLSMNPQTIVHVPSVVARVAQPGLRSILRRAVLRHNRQTEDYVYQLGHYKREFEEYEKKLKAASDRNQRLKTETDATEGENARLTHELKVAREQLRQQETKFLAEKSELASADIVNSCLESVNMLREAHRALMNNNTELRGQLEKANTRYRAECNRWKLNFNELRAVYESRLQHEPVGLEAGQGNRSPGRSVLSDGGRASIRASPGAAGGASPALSGKDRSVSPKRQKRLSSTFRIPDDDLVEMEAALMETSLKATQKIEQYIEATKYVPEGADAVEVASTTRVRERRGRTSSSPMPEGYPEGVRTTVAGGGKKASSPPVVSEAEALDVGEWVGALGMAGERLQLNSPK